MRLSSGIDDKKLKKYLNLSFSDVMKNSKTFDSLLSQRLIEFIDDKITPTKKGMLLNNYLVKSIVNENNFD